MTLLVVALAGGLGAVVRYLTSLAFAGRTMFPWAVFAVNVTGSALGGVVVGLSTTGVVSPDLRLVLVTGVAGGLTTFSTWSTESVQLFLNGKQRMALANVILNLVVGLAAATAGYVITTLVT